jgi:hypothetical protein
VVVRDVVNNSNARQQAYDECAERHDTLIRWHEEMQRNADTTVDGERKAKPF